MRYSLGIRNKTNIVKQAIDGSYRWLMLAMMAIELILLAWPVALEALHR